jgi:hypothetical protein
MRKAWLLFIDPMRDTKTGDDKKVSLKTPHTLSVPIILGAVRGVYSA